MTNPIVPQMTNLKSGIYWLDLCNDGDWEPARWGADLQWFYRIGVEVPLGIGIGLGGVHLDDFPDFQIGPEIVPDFTPTQKEPET